MMKGLESGGIRMQSNKRERGNFLNSLSMLRHLWKYFTPYRATLVLDLFCALLTTVCDLVLPLIVRRITGGFTYAASVTVSLVLKLGALYIVLRIIDAAS